MDSAGPMDERGPIDESEPGSETGNADGSAAQLSTADSLIDRGVADPLDEGYSPPDREPTIDVPTAGEERAGLSLDELLAAEEPDVTASGDGWDGSWTGGSGGKSTGASGGDEIGNERSGRLVDTDGGAMGDTEKSLVADDVGIDGAAASAEEAAMHVVDPEDDNRW